MSDTEIKSLTNAFKNIEVILVSGKKANKAYREAHPPTFRREEANLSQKGLNAPQVDPKPNKPKET